MSDLRRLWASLADAARGDNAAVQTRAAVALAEAIREEGFSRDGSGLRKFMASIFADGDGGPNGYRHGIAEHNIRGESIDVPEEHHRDNAPAGTVSSGCNQAVRISDLDWYHHSKEAARRA